MLSIAQLANHIKVLAQEHEINFRRGSDELLPRLAENKEVLLQTYNLVMGAVKNDDRITPAAEWLIDNFYLIEEQIRIARRHLPKGYSLELPRISKGPLANYPRIYAIALELISHCDGRLDAKNIKSVVSAYQSVTTLKLGELWAFPIMLRIALIENLRRVSSRIMFGCENRNNAKLWADRLLEVAESDPKNMVLVMADLSRSVSQLSSSFVVEIVYRLQGQNPALAFLVAWIEQQLSGTGFTTDSMMQFESREQATNQVSMSNTIGSLRFLDAMDWHEFVETLSVVEKTLSGDPANIYQKMDFTARDHYRHVVERIAKCSSLPESEIARTVIALSNEGAKRDGQDARSAHVGYYLIDKGVARLKQMVAFKDRSVLTYLRSVGRKLPFLFYFGSIVLFTSVVTAAIFWKAYPGIDAVWGLVVTAALLALCASQFSVSLVNWLAAFFVKPHLLPRMDYSKGIPAESRTLVVVPTMVTSPQNIESLLEGLEVRYLANQDGNLHLGLLTDFSDAPQETMPDDEQLVQLAQKGVEKLNEKYSGSSGNVFFLFHRRRTWNDKERTWMGHERKRGKIEDLNALLRGISTNGRFMVVVGDTKIFPTIKYVITLDTDTLLPRDSARLLIETIAHPLTRPKVGDARRSVTEGYSIIQPRVESSMPTATRSLFSQLSAGEPGIDPYTQAVSDVYQDVFHEGSFVGKGIYDVDAFVQVMNNRLPENLILSHDLLEGCYLRSALVSDICLYEEHPDSYLSDTSRRHRWIRGDWQIFRWLFSSVPGAEGTREKNPISTVSQWKIFDNLRRSLVPMAMTGFLVIGWAMFEPVWLSAGLVLGVVLTSPMLAVTASLIKRRRKLPFETQMHSAANSILRHFAQSAMTVLFLPYESVVSLDAITRSLVRMALTHRNLLEWVSFGEQNIKGPKTVAGYFRVMWVSPLASMAMFASLISWRPEALAVAMPFLVLWFVAPAFAWALSRPVVHKEEKLIDEQTVFLRKLSRRTWFYFETFIGPEDNWLPIDNYQEEPIVLTAHRTSPTNIGISLLASLSAYDFGYISAGQLMDRTGRQMQTMGRLERFRGHFYNWYDTQTLKPLPPLYVSTVDSGNLGGHLMTLKAGLLNLHGDRILPERLFDGLADTLFILSSISGKHVGSSGSSHVFSTAALEGLERLDQLQGGLGETCKTLTSAKTMLDRVLTITSDIAKNFGDDANPELKCWVNVLSHQAKGILDDMMLLAPWVFIPELDDDLWRVCARARTDSTEQAPSGRGVTADQVDQLVKMRGMLQMLDGVPTLDGIARLGPECTAAIDEASRSFNGSNPNIHAWLSNLRQGVVEAGVNAGKRIEAIDRLVSQCDDFMAMEYDLLYDNTRNLLVIGYNVSEHWRDNSFYDLLASESRLCSFVAIAQGKLPQKHWFALGRLLTSVDGRQMLLSWGGSMFEYLMPLLIMPTYTNTLLDQTYRAVVKRQIEYGNENGIPWGISESCYNMTDVQLNYQYRAFGVPGIGFKRELVEDLVVAPYASVMALMVEPEEACANLQRMEGAGFHGRYGFYEAIDYTPSRLPPGHKHFVIKSFMTHHQGMSFLSLAYLLLDQPMQRRLRSDPMFQSTELLLHERVPKVASIHPLLSEISQVARFTEERAVLFRAFQSPNTPIPEVHLLSNGNYHAMVTNAGGGYSRWKDISLTRWREDTTRDNSGMFCYIRDVSTGKVWSAAYQPTLKETKNYEAIFTQGRAEFRSRYQDIDTHMEITISPEDDIELRRIHVLNRAGTRRTIELTTYGEVVLAPQAADEAHVAFSNLFVQTQIVREHSSIMCTRRPRSKTDPVHWMLHMMSVHGKTAGDTSYETDRSKFIGRSRSVVNPYAMSVSSDLSNTDGSVLDPVVAIRRKIVIEPEQTIIVDIVTGVTESRDASVRLMEKYKDRRMNDRIFALASTHGKVVLSLIKATETDAQLYGSLASSIVYSSTLRRASASIMMTNHRGQSGLWGYGISGDLPIALLRISDKSKTELVSQLLQAHAYWRTKGLHVDLLIWNEDYSSYRQVLQDQITGLIAASTEAQLLNKPGGIFVRHADQIPLEDKILMQSVARIIIIDSDGNFADQIERRKKARGNMPQLEPVQQPRPDPRQSAERPQRDLTFFNGFGGFTHDGREYVTIIMPGQPTPAPWLNVLANRNFGTIVTESGGSYTWVENAHLFRLTPWYNDPICDTSGEAMYVRDEDTGRFWSPTPLPAPGSTPYVTRHGFGYSVFEHTENGIVTEMWVYVDKEAAVKFSVVKVHNVSGRSRRLSVTGYFELLLGELRHKEAMHVISEIDTESGALFAQNFYNTEFAGRVAFLSVNNSMRSVTASRGEFLGRNGTPANPAAMRQVRLSGKTGAGFDPCAAMQVPFELADGEEKEIVFTLGAGHNAEDARSLIRRFQGSESARAALEGVWDHWNRTLGVIYVETPDQSVNVLTNGWLLYQTLSCRIWGRSGYYQSGGAFGFRDQLQDIMALLYAEPAVARQHLLLCAGHQFPEGDVQHWWHPPTGKGVRTHCSDDYLWLVYAACRYVSVTGDTGILDEPVNFINDRPVNHDEDSYYGLPAQSTESATLYQHCVRAVRRGLRFGQNGLPLIGSGDWNDSFNLVGIQGKGESVWLAFFLYDVLMQFSGIAEKRSDAAVLDQCRTEAARLLMNIEQNSWDGEWYRRAYFDNGEPLGSKGNLECRIDSIPQSWSVISGAGDPQRMRTAMESVDKHLVDRDKALIHLFDPPFDRSDSEPGYVKGYITGTRENGGQYTHAAIWAVVAYAMLGDNDRAWELLSAINPVRHGDTKEKIAVYKVEPYVMAADIYSVAPHTGRGGWTWYTGSAGWMYRLIVEYLLGIRLEVNRLVFKPCLPQNWKSFKMHYRFYGTFYNITVVQNGASHGVTKVVLDGVEQGGMGVALNDDHKDHTVEVEMT